MAKIRYEATHISTENEPMGCLGSTQIVEVEDAGDLESTDRAAFLLASYHPGELLELVRVSPQREIAWRNGMAIPGEIITADMVGVTFAAAIKSTLSSHSV